MGDENVLLACAGALDIKPERIAAAWQKLSPRPDDEWADRPVRSPGRPMTSHGLF